MNISTNWNAIRKPLVNIYNKNGFQSNLGTDEAYLKQALIDYHSLWEKQFKSINEINYVMFSEAPLWGNSKSYIYNLNTPTTSYFRESDLEFGLNLPGGTISNKADFLKKLRDIGFIIVDISPFALNKNTSINYQARSKTNPQGLSGTDYQAIVNQTVKSYLIPILQDINTKTSGKVKYFFRYKRVKDLFEVLIEDILINENMIANKSLLVDIAKQGGMIDRSELYNILK